MDALIHVRFRVVNFKINSCLSLNIPLTAETSREQTETISNEALQTCEERSTTIPKGSRKKPSETGDANTKICRICGKRKPLSEFYFRKDNGTYRAECKDCLKDKTRQRNTGWTHDAYEEAFKKQHGRCAICGKKLNSTRYTRFAGDHDHKTGKTRGLLCTKCNTALGLVDEDITTLKNMITYIDKYK